MLELILVPLDTSCFAEHALGYAVGLARRARAKVLLVCVHTSVPPDRTVQQEERYLARIASELAPKLPHAITYQVKTDEPWPPPDASRVAELLSRHARDHAADVTVMATHGRGGVRRALLGSVADSLLRIASRPVLLIRPSYAPRRPRAGSRWSTISSGWRADCASRGRS